MKIEREVGLRQYSRMRFIEVEEVTGWSLRGDIIDTARQGRRTRRVSIEFDAQ
jgi:hypothetical protein